MNFEACKDGKGAWIVSNKNPDPQWTLDYKGYKLLIHLLLELT